MKQILIIYFLLFAIEAYSQKESSSLPKSGIYINNGHKDKSKVIKLNSKIKYWLNNTKVPKKGWMEIVKDSSIIVNQKEIKLADINKIGVRSGFSGPLIFASVVTIPFIVFPPIFITFNYLTNPNFD